MGHERLEIGFECPAADAERSTQDVEVVDAEGERSARLEPAHGVDECEVAGEHLVT